MKRFVQGEARSQMSLLPECLDDFVPEDNPVRVVEAFIDALNLEKLGFAGVVPQGTEWPKTRADFPARQKPRTAPLMRQGRSALKCRLPNSGGFGNRGLTRCAPNGIEPPKRVPDPGKKRNCLRLAHFWCSISPRSLFWPAFQILVRYSDVRFQVIHTTQIVRFHARLVRGIFLTEAK